MSEVIRVVKFIYALNITKYKPKNHYTKPIFRSNITYYTHYVEIYNLYLTYKESLTTN